MKRNTPWRSLALGITLLGCAASAGAAALQPPAGYRTAGRLVAKAAAPCTAPPQPFTGELEFPSKYEGSGRARDTFNPESAAAYKKKTQPIVSMEKGLVSLVKHYQRSGNLADADCARGWLLSWAAADAMRGVAKNHTGRSLRKWSLGTMASAYLQLKFAPAQPLAAHAKDAARIETWLSAMATQVAAEWPTNDPIEKINNHYYWAAWALMATAIATDRREHFEAALALYRVFEKQVDADGLLPNEMRRASRAAEYHNYAMAPLAMIAAFAKANGVTLAGEPGSALSRLAAQAQTALDDPQHFKPQAGALQETKALEPSSASAWLEPYCWTLACSPSQQRRLAATRPLGNTRLGGDLTAVFATPSTAAPAASAP